MDSPLYKNIEINDQNLKALLSGFDFEKLSSETVLAMILSYVMPMEECRSAAVRLLTSFGSISSTIEADISDVARVLGVTESKAAIIKLIPSVGTFYQLDKFRGGKVFESVEDIAEYCVYRFARDDRESFFVLMLDSHMRMLGLEEIAQGSECSVDSNLEKLGAVLFRYGATSYILIHNHPARDFPYPSDNDAFVTKMIYELMSNFKKYMVEHIVVSGQAYMPIMQLMRKNGYDFGVL